MVVDIKDLVHYTSLNPDINYKFVEGGLWAMRTNEILQSHRSVSFRDDGKTFSGSIDALYQ